MDRMLTPGEVARRTQALGVVWTALLTLLLALCVGVVGVVAGGSIGCVGGCYGLVRYDRYAATGERIPVQSHTWRRVVTIQEYGDHQVQVCDSRSRRTRRPRTCHEETRTEWHTDREVEATGEGTGREWPVVVLEQTCDVEEVGCEREGPRSEKLALELQLPNGRFWTCRDLPEATWSAAVDGELVTLPVGAVTGMPWCRDLRIE
jgi:hypothetical protein